MPTGYTADLIDGKETPEQFMFGSLRAMGVAIMQRDDHIKNPVERRTVSDYDYRRVTEAEAELKTALDRTDDEWKALYAKTVKERADAKSKAQVKYELETRRLDAAEALVRSKKYPASHEGWKDFMLQQIEISRPYEPGDWYNIEPFEEWKASSLDADRRTLQYAQEGLTRQEEIVKGNNEWLDEVQKILDVTIV